MKRPRRFSFGTLRGVVRLHGSAEELLSSLSTSVEVNGDIFLQIDDTRLIEMAEMARKQGSHIAPEDLDSYPLEYFSPPCIHNIMLMHGEKKEQLQGNDGCYIADIEQQPRFGAGGPFIPTLVTHGLLVSYGANKIFASAEHLLAQGEPLVEAAGHSSAMCLKPRTGGLKNTSRAMPIAPIA